MTTATRIAQALTKKKLTLAVAESCTGGLISSTLTDIPGSSAFFMAGVISYSNENKTRFVGVPAKMIAQRGAVSAPVAKTMAENIRKIVKTDYGIGITGIAGPTGGTKTKPVGLVFMAASSRQKTMVRRFVFKGTRLAIKKQATEAALKLALKLIGQLSTVNGHLTQDN